LRISTAPRAPTLPPDGRQPTQDYVSGAMNLISASPVPRPTMPDTHTWVVTRDV
jgi:hypothetical protein